MLKTNPTLPHLMDQNLSNRGHSISILEKNDRAIIYLLRVTAEAISQFKRLDQFICHHIETLGRDRLKEVFQEGHLQIYHPDSTSISSDQIKNKSVIIQLNRLPPLNTEMTLRLEITPSWSLEGENIPLDILFEDEHLLVLNKAQGIVCHPAPGHKSGTLIHALIYHYPNIKQVGSEGRPGLVHRLDQGTSGILVVAKNNLTHQKLCNLFATHHLIRRYLFFSIGQDWLSPAHIRTFIGRHPQNRQLMSTKCQGKGKEAITFFHKLQNLTLGKKNALSLGVAKLETGRTHQIRVHACEKLFSSLLGDQQYARPKNQWALLIKHLPSETSQIFQTFSLKENIEKNQSFPLLHAFQLAFYHPITQEPLAFQAMPPKDFLDLQELLFPNYHLPFNHDLLRNELKSFDFSS